MKLPVMTLSGDAFIVEVSPEMSILDVKELILHESGCGHLTIKMLGSALRIPLLLAVFLPIAFA